MCPLGRRGFVLGLKGVFSPTSKQPLFLPGLFKILPTYKCVCVCVRACTHMCDSLIVVHLRASAQIFNLVVFHVF